MEPYSPDSTEGLDVADSTSFHGLQQTNRPLTLTFGLGLDASGNKPGIMPDNFETKHQNGSFCAQRTFNTLLSDCEDQFKSATESPAAGSPTLLSPGINTTVSESMLNDVNTQMSLVDRSENLHLDESTVDQNTFWGVLHNQDSPDDSEIRKAMKVSRNSDASSTISSSVNPEEDEHKVFDAHLATNLASTGFGFNMFGSDVPSVYAFGGKGTSNVTNTSDSPLMTPVSTGKVMQVEVPSSTSASPAPQIHEKDKSSKTEATSSTTSNGEVITIQPAPPIKYKEPPLNLSFPSKTGGYELVITSQPEEQHRARYMTEGSRGAVKDKSGNGYPTIKLSGVNQPVNLMVYIGSDTGKVKPHGFYQACKVCSKNATPCNERDVDGTTVIDITLEPNDNMTATIDCVGILKLRNADVEQRIGVARSKKKSTRARMVFRVSIPKPNGGIQTLQVASTSISCTQPAGQPEICKMSLSECCCEGGEELFIIGKNFLKGTMVYFREKQGDDIVWSTEATYDSEYFQASHMIVKVPPYRETEVLDQRKVEILVSSGGRTSEPAELFYVRGDRSQKNAAPIKKEKEHEESGIDSDVQGSFSPGLTILNQQTTTGARQKLEFGDVSSEGNTNAQGVTPMETDCFKSKYVSPEAIALNKQFEMASRENGGVHDLQPRVTSEEVIDVEMSESAKKRRISANETLNLNECLSELQQMKDEHGSEIKNDSVSESSSNQHLQLTPDGSFVIASPALSSPMSTGFVPTEQEFKRSSSQQQLATYPETAVQNQQALPVFGNQELANQVLSPQESAIQQSHQPSPSLAPQQANSFGSAQHSPVQAELNPFSSGEGTESVPNFEVINHPQLTSPTQSVNSTITSPGSGVHDLAHENQNEVSAVHQLPNQQDSFPNTNNLQATINHLPENAFSGSFGVQQAAPNMNDTIQHHENPSQNTDAFSLAAQAQIQDQIRLKQLQQKQEEQRLKAIQEQEAHHRRLKELQEKERFEKEKKEEAIQMMLSANLDMKHEDLMPLTQQSHTQERPNSGLGLQTMDCNVNQQMGQQIHSSQPLQNVVSAYQQALTSASQTAMESKVQLMQAPQGFLSTPQPQQQPLQQQHHQLLQQQQDMTQQPHINQPQQLNQQAQQMMHVQPSQTQMQQSSLSTPPPQQHQQQVHVPQAVEKLPDSQQFQSLHNTLQELLSLLKNNQTTQQPQNSNTMPQLTEQQQRRLITSIQEQASVLPLLANQAKVQSQPINSNQISQQQPQQMPQSAVRQQSRTQEPQQQPQHQLRQAFTVTAALPATQMSSTVQQAQHLPKTVVTSTPVTAVPQKFKIIPCNVSGLTAALQNHVQGQKLQLTPDSVRFVQEQVQQHNIQITNTDDILALLQSSINKGNVPLATSQEGGSAPHMTVLPSQAISSHQVVTQNGASNLIANPAKQPIMIANPEGGVPQMLNIIPGGAVVNKLDCGSTLKQMLATPVEKSHESERGLLAHLLNDDKNDSSGDIFGGPPQQMSTNQQQPPVVTKHQHQPMETAQAWNQHPQVAVPCSSTDINPLPKLDSLDVAQTLKMSTHN